MKRRGFLKAGAVLPLAATLRAEVPAAAMRRKELYSLLGDLPPRDRAVTAKTISTEERPAYTLERLVLDLNGIEAAPAYFAKPKGATGRLPTILFNHSHGGGYHIGKEEFVNGREYMTTPPYAEFLTALGFGALCFDTWIFGERAFRPELDQFKLMIWNGQVLWGMMVYDSIKAIDYLTTRPDVDVSRISTVGMSMGSAMAQWVSALDTRVRACVDICCLTDYQALIAADNVKGHGIYYYVPSLLKHFTASQINALIAPRPHLSLDGNEDGLTPTAGLDRIDSELRKAYADAGAPQNWKILRYEGGHKETPVMREEVRKFLLAHA